MEPPFGLEIDFSDFGGGTKPHSEGIAAMGKEKGRAFCPA
jgi:hypothetical protein